MADPMAKVDNLVLEATQCVRGKEQGQVVALCEEIIDSLVLVGWALKNVELPPLSVGVHPDNRYGVGIKVD